LLYHIIITRLFKPQKSLLKCGVGQLDTINLVAKLSAKYTHMLLCISIMQL